MGSKISDRIKFLKNLTKKNSTLKIAHLLSTQMKKDQNSYCLKRTNLRISQFVNQIVKISNLTSNHIASKTFIKLVLIIIVMM
jgi:hypothetical protein